MTEPWASLHTYHAGHLDSLVRAAAPHVSGRAWFFLRYWEGGPHLRVRVRGSADGLREALVAHLAAHPGPPGMDPSAYAAVAADLAAREERSDYERELRPADSVAVVPYRPEHDAYGAGPSLEVVERHFTESSDLALAVIAADVPAASRLGAGLAAGLVALAVAEPDLDRLIAAFTDAGAWDETAAPHLEAAFRAHRDRLHAEVGSAWSGTEPTGTGLLPRWRRSVRDLRDGLDKCFANGEPAPDGGSSPMAWQVAHLPADERVPAGIVLRCAHLFCNRLGLTIADELHVNYLIARVVADLGPTRKGRP